MMEKSCYFSRIPIEVLCMILNHLPEDDKISLKFAYPHFFSQHRHINVRENFAFCEENIAQILQLHHCPDVVTELDFNFCYWMSSKEITNFVKQCNNLKELGVAHSTVNSQHLTEILCENGNISRLSLSIQQTPESFWSRKKPVIKSLHQIRHNSKEILGGTSTSWESLLSMSHFGKCQQTLAQLESLDLHMGQNPIILGTLLSACKKLENLSLRVDIEKEIPEEFLYCKVETSTSRANSILLRDRDNCSLEPTECWNHFPPHSLKSFALQHSSRKKTTPFDPEMESFIQQIVEKSCSYLECWWAPIPSVPVRETGFNLKNMIAWKESKSFGDVVPPHMPAMESLACNKYMQRGDFNSPHLKQIECGFWKDNFTQFCLAHPILERVRLNKRPCEVSELYSIINWSRLPRIKVLSLHSRIIYASDYLQNSWKRNRAERALCMLLTACPSLEELEICPDFHQSYESLKRDLLESFITADSLCGLSVCTSLKKFSINSVTISYKRSEINDTSFLEEIVTKCPNLESLYIQDLRVNLINNGLMERNPAVVNTLYNDCIERCCLALRSAHRLRVLRLKLRVVSHSFDQMIRLLAYYPSLVQLGLIVSAIDLASGKLNMCNWNEAEFTAFFVDLVEHLPKLIALLVVLPAASESYCVAATAALKAKFQPVRPCFCVQITKSLDSSNPPNLPLVHYQALAHDPHPSVGELPFHLTPTDSHY